MQTSYVLSGSGMKLFAYLRALRALFVSGRLPKQLIGTSGGGLVAMFVAAHFDPHRPFDCLDRAEKLARSLSVTSLLDLGFFRWPHPTHGIYKGDRILAKLREELPRTWKDFKLPVFVVTADRTADATKIWGVDDDVEPALVARATMSLPIFDAVKIKGHWHTDGGTRANYPLAFFGDEENVIGLRFRPLAKRGVLGPGEEGAPVQAFTSKISFQLDNIDDMMEATALMHMQAAVKAQTIMLDVPGSGLDFGMEAAEIDAMMEAGEKSAQKWLRSQVRKTE